MIGLVETDGRTSKKYQTAQEKITYEMSEIIFAPKTSEAFCNNLRSTIDSVRKLERQIMQICIRQAGMQRKEFIASFPKNETNLGWIDKHIRAKRKYSSTLSKMKPEIIRAQKKLVAIEVRSTESRMRFTSTPSMKSCPSSIS